MHVCAHEMSKLIALNCRMVFKAKLHLNSTHFLLHWSYAIFLLISNLVLKNNQKEVQYILRVRERRKIRKLNKF